MKEFERWLKQAEADFDSATYLFEGAKYYACANYCQQTVEKALKCLSLFRNKPLVKTHSITSLAKSLGLPEKLSFGVAGLEPVFRESKYPDVSKELPCEEYEEEDTQIFLNTAEEVLLWIKTQLK